LSIMLRTAALILLWGDKWDKAMMAGFDTRQTVRDMIQELQAPTLWGDILHLSAILRGKHECPAYILQYFHTYGGIRSSRYAEKLWRDLRKHHPRMRLKILGSKPNVFNFLVYYDPVAEDTNNKDSRLIIDISAKPRPAEAALLGELLNGNCIAQYMVAAYCAARLELIRMEL